jgi:hypothetical protein
MHDEFLIPVPIEKAPEILIEAAHQTGLSICMPAPTMLKVSHRDQPAFSITCHLSQYYHAPKQKTMVSIMGGYSIYNSPCLQILGWNRFVETCKRLAQAETTPTLPQSEASPSLPTEDGAGEEERPDEAELISLYKQRRNVERHIRSIEVRESEFVLPSEIPLQLLADKRHLREKLKEIEQRIEELEQSTRDESE